MESVGIGLFSEDILEWLSDDDEIELLLTAVCDLHEQAQSSVTPDSTPQPGPTLPEHATSIPCTSSSHPLSHFVPHKSAQERKGYQRRRWKTPNTV